MYEQRYAFSFEAAHDLSASKPATECESGDHPYARLHGHSFVVHATLQSATLESGHWVTDFAAVKAACAEVKELLDHQFLNNVNGLATPTLENIAHWIFNRLKDKLPLLARVDVERPTLNERAAYYE